jgi:phosphate starvation-inducible membrane PsiE
LRGRKGFLSTRGRRDHRLPVDRVVLLLFAMSFASLLAGTVAGVIWLSMLSGLVAKPPFKVSIHPDHQIYGFLLLFISGVFFVLAPRFKNLDPASVEPFAYTLVGLVALDVLLVVLGTRPGQLLLVAASIVLLASAMFVIRVPTGRFAVSDSSIILSVSALVLSLVPSWPYSRPDFIDLALLEFPTSMIYGVAIRTVHSGWRSLP